MSRKFNLTSELQLVDDRQRDAAIANLTVTCDNGDEITFCVIGRCADHDSDAVSPLRAFIDACYPVMRRLQGLVSRALPYMKYNVDAYADNDWADVQFVTIHEDGHHTVEIDDSSDAPCRWFNWLKD